MVEMARDREGRADGMVWSEALAKALEPGADEWLTE